MRTLLDYSVKERRQVEQQSPCKNARAAVDDKGELYAQRCKRRFKEDCPHCAVVAQMEKQQKNRDVLSTIDPQQALWVTLTSPPFRNKWLQAVWNSLLSVLMTNLLVTLNSRLGGSIWWVWAVERNKSNHGLHVHLLLIKHSGWSQRNINTVNSAIRSTRTFTLPGMLGNCLKFGRVFSASVPKSNNHLERIGNYLVKESSESLCASKGDREMQAYIVKCRNAGTHRLPPLKRVSRVSGRGFNGNRVHWCSNWGTYQYVPEAPELDMPESELLSAAPLRTSIFPEASSADWSLREAVKILVSVLQSPRPIPIE